VHDTAVRVGDLIAGTGRGLVNIHVCIARTVLTEVVQYGAALIRGKCIAREHLEIAAVLLVVRILQRGNANCNRICHDSIDQHHVSDAWAEIGKR
jgi:hypothetical protein